MTTTVTFCIQLGNEECLSEYDITADFESFREKLCEIEVLEGAIIINSSGNPEIRVEDELEAAIQNICFLSIPKLKAGEHVVVRYFSIYGYFRLDPEGDNVLISGDYVPSIRVLRNDLLLALYACGQRFVALLRQLRAGDPLYEGNISHLEDQAESARRIIEMD